MSEDPVVVPWPSPPPSFLCKSYSFHAVEKPHVNTVAEAEAKAMFRTGSMTSVPRVEIEGIGIRPLRENFFIMKDRMEMEREGKVATFDRRTTCGGMMPPARTPPPCSSAGRGLV